MLTRSSPSGARWACSRAMAGAAKRARPEMWPASTVSASQQAMTEPTKAAGLTSSIAVMPAPLNHVGMRSRCMNTLRRSSAHGRPCGRPGSDSSSSTNAVSSSSKRAKCRSMRDGGTTCTRKFSACTQHLRSSHTPTCGWMPRRARHLARAASTFCPTKASQKSSWPMGAPAMRMPQRITSPPLTPSKHLRSSSSSGWWRGSSSAHLGTLRSRLRLTLASVASPSSVARSPSSTALASSRPEGSSTARQQSSVSERTTVPALPAAHRSSGPCSDRSKPNEPSGQPWPAPCEL